MIAFITFLSLIIGLLWHDNLLWIIIVSTGWLSFVLWRFSPKGFALAGLAILGGILYGNIEIPYDKNETQFNGMVIAAKENYFLFESRLIKYYIYEKNNTREVGDCLSITGDISTYHFAVMESQIDFNQYLANKGVNLQLFPTMVSERFLVPLRRKQIIAIFNDGLMPETKALVNSLLFGENDYDSDIVKYGKSLQVMHIISLSGLHLNLLFMGSVYLLGLIIPPKWARPLALVILSPYLLLVATKISMIRVIGTFILQWCNEVLWKKKFTRLDLICTLGVICLLVSRYIVFQNGFLLSFGIPILLIFSQNSFSAFRNMKRAYIIPLAIILFFIPITVSYNFELNLLVFFIQILFLPILMVLYIISLVSFYTVPFISLMNIFGNSMSSTFGFLSRLDLSIITGSMSPVTIIVFYVGCLLLLLSFETKRRGKFDWGFIMILGSIVVSVLPVRNMISNSISFINVGQGDSILIREGQKTVLIDTGGSLYSDISTDCLIPYLKKQKISQIDYLITTHEDLDHSGGKQSLFDNFRVKNYLSDFNSFPFSFGSLTFENLNTGQIVSTNPNDSSLVLYLEFMDKKWLFTGDASTVIENSIIRRYPNLSVDILKIGHHGSDSSTSETFLETIAPKEAIISVGRNSYGHPTAKVIERLEKYFVTVHRTDLEGTITYTEWSF